MPLPTHTFANLYKFAINRLINAVKSQLIEINLTDVLRCKRLFYFERVATSKRSVGDEVEKTRVDLVKLFGTMLHELLVIPDCVKELEMRYCDKDVCLVAKPDFWCPAAREVIEVKTVSRLANIPRLNHLAQIRTYMYLLSAERGSLVYISRTTGEVKVFEVSSGIDKGAWGELWRRVLEYRDIVLNKRSPPEPEPGLWCRNCPYRNMCNSKVEEVKVGEHQLMKLLKILAGKA